MRNLIVIRNILKILKKVSAAAAYSLKSTCFEIFFIPLLLVYCAVLNIINPTLCVLFIWLPFICQFLLCVHMCLELIYSLLICRNNNSKSKETFFFLKSYMIHFLFQHLSEFIEYKDTISLVQFFITLCTVFL